MEDLFCTRAISVHKMLKDAVPPFGQTDVVLGQAWSWEKEREIAGGIQTLARIGSPRNDQ